MPMASEFVQQDVAQFRKLGDAMSEPLFLTVDEVVVRYRNQISEGTFRNWRSKRIGPSFIKIGKAVLYPIDELERWDRSNLISCLRTKFLSFDERESNDQSK